MNKSDGAQSSHSQVVSDLQCNIQKTVENPSKKCENQGKKNKKRGEIKHGNKRKFKGNNERTSKHMKLNDKQTEYKKTDIQKNKEIESQRAICSFYMQGKCTKEEKCQFSHAVSVPIKLELCKFYLLDCCTKGNKCLYMHSQFPCKFYHTGVECRAGNHCKFAHGKPLSKIQKQILFKHIETPPEKILEEFPELTLKDVLHKINSTEQPFGFYSAQELS